MPSVVVASTNPTKIKATLLGFERLFPGEKIEITACSVPSGVKDQPTSEAETLQGAHNRVDAASRAMPDADFWIGLEGGIQEHEEEMHSFAWVVIKSSDGQFGKGRTGSFLLPVQIAALIRTGKEMGEADDIVFKQVGVAKKQGSVGLLTGGAIDRATHYAIAVTFALIPFKNSSLYTIV